MNDFYMVLGPFITNLKHHRHSNRDLPWVLPPWVQQPTPFPYTMDWGQQLTTKVRYFDFGLGMFMYKLSWFRCFDHCSTRGDDYYGLIWEKQCSCGNNKPDDKYKKAESHCGTVCPGDSSAKCGGGSGTNRVNIYQIGGATTTTTVVTTSSKWISKFAWQLHIVA